MWELSCEKCGDSFESKRSDGRYCSSSCRQTAYREREKEDDAQNDSLNSVDQTLDEIVDDQQEVDSSATQEDFSSNHGLTKEDLLLIQVNGYLSHFVVHLRNTYEKKTKLSYLTELLEGLEDLQLQFKKKDLLLYTQYMFVDDLEYLSGELSSFIELAQKSKPNFRINSTIKTLLFELPDQISENTQMIRQQYG
jgi:hypothetical protein